MHRHLPHPERRRGADRREKPAAPLSKYSFVSCRRRAARRKEDVYRHVFVDRYGTRLWAVLMLFLMLAVLDAILTIVLVESGVAIEANPVMAYYLAHGPMTFFSIKVLMTVFALVTFCVCKNKPYVKIAMVTLMGAYLLTVMYELALVHYAGLR